MNVIKKFKGITPRSLNSITVENNDLMYALKQWKRMVKDSNIIQELYDRKFYKKRSEQKRLQLQLAKYNLKKDIEQ